MKFAAHSIIAVLFILPSLSANAATCCGASFALPALITGDDEGQVTTSVGHSAVVDDVYGNGKWAKRENPESVQTIKVEFAKLLSDRWQAGASVPLIRRERTNQSSMQSSVGIGDVVADIGYEYLPEWDYSLWKPKGIGFFQVSAPTGLSAEQSLSSDGLDIRGRGVWSAGLGTILTKLVYPWDVQLTGEVHHGLARSLTSPSAQAEVILEPGWGLGVAIGAGRSYRSFRGGAALAWNYEEPLAVRFSSGSDAASTGSLQRFVTGVLQAAYLASDDWALSASYSDQTLFGAPNNTTLTRAILVSLQRRWPR